MGRSEHCDSRDQKPLLIKQNENPSIEGSSSEHVG